MNTIQRYLLVPFGLSALFLASSCSSSSGDGGTPQQNLAQTLDSEGLTSLRAALQRVGLLEALTTGTLTVFGPSNAAFDELPPDFIDDLTNQELTGLLLYHVVNTAAISSATLLGTDELAMANGADTIVDPVGHSLFINEGRIVKADVQASNGVLHVIDRVLLPPRDIQTTLETRGLLTLLALLKELDDDGLRGEPKIEVLTLVAPTDAAFAALPPNFFDGLTQKELFELISYHGIEGEVVASEALNAEVVPSLDGQPLLFGFSEGAPIVNGANIELFNIPFTDGVLYIIDEFLHRPGTLTAEIDDRDELSVLLTLLDATGGAAIFDDPALGSFTVFAPTNDAFDALPQGFLDDLLNEPGRPTLTRILQFHTLGGFVTINDVADAADDGLLTLEGGTLDVGVSVDGVTVGGANVTEANILASNGLIHVIDTVLLPDDIVP